MTWEITWALILGCFLSATVQAVVRRQTITRLLGDDHPKTLAVAARRGAASSSCSYAAVALARSLFRKGANFTSAMTFEVASTNLVIELGIILALLMGWQFTLGEFVGGPIMIVVLAVLFRAFLKPRLLDAARTQADKGLAGSMEGHAAMDMSVAEEGSVWRRLRSSTGFTAVSHIFVMEWAAVLWNGGISFSGVVSFIFADLLIIPILVIYKKYYGGRMAVFLFGTFYVVEVVFGLLRLIPQSHHAQVTMASVSWNYTTFLNIAFLVLAAALVIRFVRTGGRPLPRSGRRSGGGGPAAAMTGAMEEPIAVESR